jgi:hypothetical protein
MGVKMLGKLIQSHPVRVFKTVVGLGSAAYFGLYYSRKLFRLVSEQEYHDLRKLKERIVADMIRQQITQMIAAAPAKVENPTEQDDPGAAQRQAWLDSVYTPKIARALAEKGNLVGDDDLS